MYKLLEYLPSLGTLLVRFTRVQRRNKKLSFSHYINRLRVSSYVRKQQYKNQLLSQHHPHWSPNAWKKIATAFMKRTSLMSITLTPGSDDVISFPDEDGAMLLLLMNVADEIKENVSSFNTAKEV
jgi:hypothetical protein